MKETRKRGIRATEQGQQKLRSAKAAKRNHNERVWTYLDIATAAEVNETTVKRFFGGKENVDKEFALSIANALNLDIIEIVDPNEWNTPTPTPTDIAWDDICNKVLETQQLRRQATAQQYELNIYVPLGLMERSKTPNPSRINPTGEELQPQKEPELQIVQTYKDDAFFLKVIAENRTEKRKQIAIIGEPGAGKTTLLGKLVEQLPKNPPDFPICIRLADLQGITIKDYLVNNWLEKAVEHINPVPKSVTPEIIEAFKQLFRQSKVWLLLDGVDEMAAESPVLVLARIREQLTDWVGKARVVLTCRFNVWDAAISNSLTDFDTYKTLEFEPDDVDEFIRQWFEEASQDEKRRNSGHETFWQSQGKRLQQQLKEPGKERIRELVRNPLRLSMLCQSWCVAEQDLPETKAALYEQFTTYFFEWKQEEFQKKYRVLKETDEKQIKQALAKLALAAMESTNRFRIEQEFAIEQMEEQWFDLAEEWGWLVLVDRDTRTKKPVYAFYHPTFQEYFAACAIDNWDFFLPREHKDRPVKNRSGKYKPYRIFETQWKEVILLWLGLKEVEKEQKEEFIEALVGFEDGWENFYQYQSHFLAAAGIAEFKQSKNADNIVNYLVYLSCIKWTDRADPVADVARKNLRETAREIAINILIATIKSEPTVEQKLINNLEHRYIESRQTKRQAAYHLGEISSNNSDAINALIDLLQDKRDWRTRCRVAWSLGQIGAGNKDAISALINILNTESSDGEERERFQAIDSLKNAAYDNSDAINLLIDLLHTSQENWIRVSVFRCLEHIACGRLDFLQLLVQLLGISYDEQTCINTNKKWDKLCSSNRDIKNIITKLINNCHDDFIRLLVAEKLGETVLYHLDYIKVLIDLLCNSQNFLIRYLSAQILIKIGVGNSQIVQTIVDLFINCNYNDRGLIAQCLIIVCFNNQEAITLLTQSLKSQRDRFKLIQAIHILGEISVENSDVAKAMVKIIQLDTDEYIRCIAAETLGKNFHNNSYALTTLTNLLCKSNEEHTRKQAAQSLAEIGIGNLKAVNILVDLLRSSKDSNIHIFAHSLNKILQENLFYIAVSGLKDCLTNQVYESDSNRYRYCYEVLWHCAQNMPYPDFYEAWHKPITSYTQDINLVKLSQILADAINDRPDLCNKVKLICIDTHQFTDPENPAPEIYDEMLNQNCPEWQNGYPDTMQKLKLYWNYLRRQSEIPLFFICYDSTALSATPTGFSDSFLKALSKFDRAICVVCEQGDIPLPTFSPQQQDLVATIVQWIEKVITEN